MARRLATLAWHIAAMALTNEQIDAIPDDKERLRLRTERFRQHNLDVASGGFSARAKEQARERRWSDLPPPELAPQEEPARQGEAPLTMRRACAIEQALFAKVRLLRELEEAGVEVHELRQVFEAARKALYEFR